MSEFATVCLKLIAEQFISQIFYTDWSFQIKNYLGKPSITPRNELEAKSLVCHGR